MRTSAYGRYHERMQVRVLRLHAGYQCGHSGMCCTAPWGVPVEAPVYARLTHALRTGELRTGQMGPEDAFVPAEAVGAGRPGQMLLAKRGDACVFFEPDRGNLCAVHRQLGHEALPSTCRHFPRVALLDPRGVSVTLSMLCPTARRLLTADIDSPFDIVAGGAVTDGQPHWEGLDARETLPPALSRSTLWDWEGITRWEEHVLRVLAAGPPVDGMLARVHEAGVRIERWRPGHGTTLAQHVDAAFANDAPLPDATLPDALRNVDALDTLARASVPAPLTCSPPPAGRADVDRRFVAPAWDALRGAVLRYLAGRAIGNWTACHTSSARGWAATFAVSCAVLRVEAARACRDADRLLDAELLLRAAAEADRILVHLVSPAALARRIGATIDAS